MASIKRDVIKQKWEETEFPLVCETCLGDNPYVRMTKEQHGKKCRICEVPFTVFTWQAGTKGRLKKVEICKNCAKTKNVCQVCIFDLQYGLPVQVRDKVLKEYGVGSNALTAPPQSDANLSWYTQSQQRALENGVSNPTAPELATLKLQSMARLEPNYERNLPKLCSFYARGECNRGAACPFRHEMPKDRNDPLFKQNTKDRYYGTNDPIAKKMIGHQKEKEHKLNIDREEGTPCTLYVYFKDTNITEMDLRDVFYSYGEIVSIRIPKSNTGAFIEYSSQASAEHALAASTKGVNVAGHSCSVSWAKSSKRGEDKNTTNTPSVTKTKPTSLAALPRPKGLKSIPSGFKVSPQVAAAIKSKPGGGVIRRSGVTAAPRPAPYYPSQNPNRLGAAAANKS